MSAITSTATDRGAHAASKIISGPLPGLVTDAVFLPNHHVLLLVAKRFVFDWDPSSQDPPRRTEVANDESEGVTVWLTPRSSRFVVGVLDTKKKLTLELWNAENQTKLKALANTWRGDDPIGRTSDDGSRFVLMSSVFRQPDASDNEFAVYDLAEGNLVHVTKLPRLATERYMLSPAVSPSGKYFSISHPYFPVEVRNSDTGKVVVRAPDNGVHYGDGGLFIDDMHFLHLAGSDAHQRLTDLTTGRVVRSLDLETRSKDDWASGPVLSPDHKRAAIPIKRAKGAEIVIWSLEDGKSTTFAVPLDICPQHCTAFWTSAGAVVASGTESPPRTDDKLRIDVESGTTALVRAAVPRFVAGGFEVLGQDKDATPNPAASSLQVTTPSGARVELPDLGDPAGLHYGISNDRLLIWRENRVKVIAKDGAISELVAKSAKPKD